MGKHWQDDVFLRYRIFFQYTTYFFSSLPVASISCGFVQTKPYMRSTIHVHVCLDWPFFEISAIFFVEKYATYGKPMVPLVESKFVWKGTIFVKSVFLVHSQRNQRLMEMPQFEQKLSHELLLGQQHRTYFPTHIVKKF